MLILLPPSETKVSGGDEGSSLDLGALSFPVQRGIREQLVDAVVALSNDSPASLKALKLGPKGLGEVERNRELRSAPVMPALSRYTGVLYDALGFDTLDSAAQKRALSSVAIFSALFGLIRASDKIPAYRLSHDSALPGGKPGALWGSIAPEPWDSVDDFVIDLRSEGYRSLSALPEATGVFVSLVKPGPAGARGAIGHHNKGTKGRLVRELLQTGANIASVHELCEWGKTHGHNFDEASAQSGSIELVVAL
ncbi:MAG: peroxide stress protein YaaA [Pontimonas sp.]|nr:peroxide stress protein YaaA [Pontimonas sp.]